MADEAKYLAVYLPEHDGEPIALIRTDLEGNHATEILRMLKFATGSVVYVAATTKAAFTRSADVAALLAAPAAAAPAVAPPDPDARAKAEIRARLADEERQSRLEREVRAELAASKRHDEAEAAPVKGR